MKQKFNLILSGGGIRSYAHLGLYKYFHENNIEFDEIVGISGGSIIAPFIFQKRDPAEITRLFKNAELHKKILPFWFIPDKFEFLFYEPKTIKIAEWIEKQFTDTELKEMIFSKRLHIIGTRYPTKGLKAKGIDLLEISDLKNSIAASTAISGIFKPHIINSATYVDGTHWNNTPIFFNFNDNNIPLIVSNLGYTGLLEGKEGRITKIIKGFEISSYARLQEDISHWKDEKSCGNRGELIVIF